MKIVFIADSYGGPRVHSGITEVNENQTYPALVKNELEKNGHQVNIDYLSFRRITDVPKLIDKYNNFDICIIQTGVVDLYPRPLTYNYTVSSNKFIKLVRRIIRLKRSFFIKYIYNKSWSTEKEVEEAIERTCNKSKAKLIWINVAPVNKFQEIETPGANNSIRALNRILKQTIKKHPNNYELEMYEKVSIIKDYESLFHKTDSHLNIDGNIFYAKHILELIKPLL